MIRYILLGITLTITIVGVRLMTQQSNVEDDLHMATAPGDSQESPTHESKPLATFDGQEQHKVLNLPVQKASPEVTTEEKRDEYAVISSPWIEDSEPRALPERYQRQGISARALKVSKDSLSDLTAGDKLSLPIPHLAQSYEMEVERIGWHPNGDKSIRGHLLDTDLPYSFIVTESTHSTFATINTPEGSFTLEAEGENGWIMSLADLDNLIDISLDDFQIPDINSQK